MSSSLQVAFALSRLVEQNLATGAWESDCSLKGYITKEASDFSKASFGAENETRTRDPNLGKVVLYQLSYFRSFKRVVFVWDCKGRYFFFTSKLFCEKNQKNVFFSQKRAQKAKNQRKLLNLLTQFHIKTTSYEKDFIVYCLLGCAMFMQLGKKCISVLLFHG